MHTDLDDKTIARRLRAAADESGAVPYDWAEFQRRRRRSMLTRAIERNRPAAIAAAALASITATAASALAHSTTLKPASSNTVAASDRWSSSSSTTRTVERENGLGRPIVASLCNVGGLARNAAPPPFVRPAAE